jgi:predicted CopG family antitoxin
MGQKLTRIISLRIKEKEYEILQKLSKQSEQSFSEFLRRRIYEVINKKII